MNDLEVAKALLARSGSLLDVKKLQESHMAISRKITEEILDPILINADLTEEDRQEILDTFKNDLHNWLTSVI